MNGSSVKVKTDILDSLIAELEKMGNLRARVGLLKPTAARKGRADHNPSLGATHEFGRGRIPARSFLRAPLMGYLQDQVESVGRDTFMRRILSGDGKGALRLLGVAGEVVIQRAFATRGFGKWKPLARATILKKGHDRQLVESGQLSQAITSDVVTKK